MNAMSAPLPVIPENAPFSAAQRAWLNGFFSGLYGGAAGTSSSMGTPPATAAQEEFPWHDPALEMDERMAMAEGRPLKRRLMAAMAQLDCGQCGYLCQTYAEALADGRETSAALCVPGAKPTQRRVKAILAEAPTAAPVAAPVVAAIAERKPVRVLSATRLTGEGSRKDVRHVAISLAGSGITYEPGDSIGLAVRNEAANVDECLTVMGASGAELVPCPDGKDRAARVAFTEFLDIARPLDRTTALLAMSAKDPREADALRKLTDGDDGAEPADADLLDLLEHFPSARPPLADLARSLPALKPRLYSIASSPRAVGEEVHLCISVVRDERRGRLRHGVASRFLAEHAPGGEPITATLETSHFRLPSDPATPVIMCGPGTGIAPFRAFLQERQATGVRGRAWLFFGDQHRASDYLYEREIAGWLEDGTLSRVDLAFSRDQREKVYVQDRMIDQAAELWIWLRDGAHFYICGDAQRMARDVDAALRKIAETEGGMTAAAAKDWIASLARQGRYLRDVY